MKNQQHKGLLFQKEAMIELNSNSLQSINSGQDTRYRTSDLTPLLDFIANGGVTQD